MSDIITGDLNRAYYCDTLWSAADAAALKTAIGAATLVRFDDILSDAEQSDERASSEWKARGSDIVKTFLGGRTIGFKCKIAKVPGKTNYEYLRAKFLAKTSFGLLLTSGNPATAGTVCVAANVKIKTFGGAEPDPGATLLDVEFVVDGTNTWDPMEVTISA